MLKRIDGTPPPDSLPPDSCKNSHSKNAVRLPNSELRVELMRAFGVDLTQVPGLGPTIVCTILGEVGTSLSAFPNVEAFVAWLKLCPSFRSSGGKRLRGGAQFGKPRLAVALRMAAQALHDDKSYLGHFYRKMRARFGGPVAIKATAHKLARIIYAMVTNKTANDETHFAKAEERQQMRDLNNLYRKAAKFGMVLTQIPFNPESHRFPAVINNA